MQIKIMFNNGGSASGMDSIPRNYLWSDFYAPHSIGSLLVNRQKLKELAKFLIPFSENSFNHNSTDEDAKVSSSKNLPGGKRNSSSSGNALRNKFFSNAKYAEDELSTEHPLLCEARNSIHLGQAAPFICILQGPSGCGKRSSLRLLCKSLNIEINEWENPHSQQRTDEKSNSHGPCHESASANFPRVQAIGDAFIEFLERSSTRPMLQLDALENDTNRESCLMENESVTIKSEHDRKRIQIPAKLCIKNSSYDDGNRPSLKHIRKQKACGIANSVCINVDSPQWAKRDNFSVVDSSAVSLGDPIVDSSNPGTSHLTLISEIPQTLMLHSANFLSRLHNTLRLLRNRVQCLSSGSILSRPIVLFIKDTFEDKLLIEKLIPYELLNPSCAITLKFPAINNKAVKNILLRILSSQGYPHKSFDSSSLVERIAQYAKGDVRFAINSLQFEIIGTRRKLAPSSAVSIRGHKRALEIDSISSRSRDSSAIKFLENSGTCIYDKDETLSIFHAIGKFLWNKRILSEWLPVNQAAVALPEFSHYLDNRKVKSSFFRSFLTRLELPIHDDYHSLGLFKVVRWVGIPSLMEDANIADSRAKVLKDDQYENNDLESKELEDFLNSVDFLSSNPKSDIGAEELESVLTYADTCGLSQRVTYESNEAHAMQLPVEISALNTAEQQGAVETSLRLKNLLSMLPSGWIDSWEWANILGVDRLCDGTSKTYMKFLACGLLWEEAYKFEDIGKEFTPVQFPPEKLSPKTFRPGLYYLPESVLEHSVANLSTVVNLLQQNYLCFFGDILDAASAACHLVFCDKTFSAHETSIRDDNPWGVSELNDSRIWYTASIYCRAILDSNLHPQNPFEKGKFLFSHSFDVASSAQALRNQFISQIQSKNKMFNMVEGSSIANTRNGGYIGSMSIKKLFSELIPQLQGVNSARSGSTLRQLRNLHSDLKDFFSTNQKKILETHSKGHYNGGEFFDVMENYSISSKYKKLGRFENNDHKVTSSSPNAFIDVTPIPSCLVKENDKYIDDIEEL